MERNRRLERLALIALCGAWIGIWGAWIPHSDAGLRQNAFDFAEWATFLMEVRAGSLHFMPDVLRLGIALASVALAFAVAASSPIWLRWGLRLAALAPGLLLMPQYPYFLDLWWSDAYGFRFATAAVVFVGVTASLFTGRFPVSIQHGSIAVLSLLAVILGVWGFATLVPAFAIRYAEAISPGWGIILFVLGLGTSAAVNGWLGLRQPQPVSQPSIPLVDVQS